MEWEKKYSGKLAVGIYVEDSLLHMVCLTRQEESIKLAEAEILQMAAQVEEIPVTDDVLVGEEGGSDQPFQFADADKGGAEAFTGGAGYSAAALLPILQRLPNKRLDLAISLPEPQIYYATFESDWGLNGKKLIKRIVDELEQNRTEGEVLKPENVRVMRIAAGRILAIVQEDLSSVLTIFNTLKADHSRHMPTINIVETAEISLVNLVNQNYSFNPGEINLIVYVGAEASRLIFMEGKEIYSISNLIGAGLDSPNVANTIYSRLLLEQDNLNLHKLDNIILTGESFEAELKEFLDSRFDEDVTIQYLQFNSLEIAGIDPLLSRFSIAVGAALHALENPAGAYNIDMVPKDIREGQKFFKLGIAGWVLLALIPLITLLVTVRIASQQQELQGMQTKITSARADIESRQGVQPLIEQERKKLAAYTRTMALVDSVTVGSKVWSTFLNKVATVSANSKGVWVTDLFQKSQGQLQLEGYSLYRAAIPGFSDALGNNSDLFEVKQEKIQEKEIYTFKIRLDLPKE